MPEEILPLPADYVSSKTDLKNEAFSVALFKNLFAADKPFFRYWELG